MMRAKTFHKDLRRSISRSLSRFLAIFAIVALGAGFFAGLNATAPDMRATADKYYDEAEMMDIHLLSTMGFNDNDIAAIRGTAGVKAVMTGYSADFLSVINGKELVMRLHSLPQNRAESNEAYLNRPVLISGRMPQNDSECLLGISKVDSNVIQLGEKIKLDDKSGNLSDTLKHDEFTIVGFVNSAYYLSFNLGSSSIGSGTINHYVYVPESAFCTEVYTDVFATVENAKVLDSFSDSYDDLVDPVIDRLENVADIREKQRFDEINNEALEKIADAQKELDDGKKEADEKLNDAYQKLLSSKQEISDAESQIASGSANLDSAQAQVDAQTAVLDESLRQYEENYKPYAAGLSAYETALADYNNNQAAYKQGWQQYSDTLNAYQQLFAMYSQLGLSDSEIAASLFDPLNPTNPDPTSPSMGEVKAGLDSTKQQLESTKALLVAAKQQLDATKQQLDATGKQFADAKAQIDSGYAALDSARAEIASGRSQIESAKAELASGKIKLRDGWNEYYSEKEKAETELSDAQKEIDDAKKELADVEPPEWYVLSRHTNVGFASYESDADRMASLSTVFPVLFFLVAALVALTTMTRMIEEERIIIGTYKALGYSDLRIMSKYLLYALLASIFGSALGIAIGFVTLPAVCYNSYLILYTGPKIILQFNLKYALEGLIAATACTLGATYAACRSTLKEQTASLLLPKAPKNGKRILLEHIPFIWNKLSFSRKVTCRNMFRYKKRLVMTLIGIAGCTGLLVTGFGIKDSISDILGNQYSDIYLYDTVITLSDEEIPQQLSDVLNDKNSYSDYLISSVKSAELTVGEQTVQGYINVPQSSPQSFINMRLRNSHESVEFTTGSVVITEKAAKLLGITIGDEVYVKNANSKLVPFTITGITENYIYHYLYISPELYEQKMGESPEYNEITAKCVVTDEAARTKLSQSLTAIDGVATASYTDSLSAMFDDMIESLDYVILVIIFCAGALAFVVLYNLININITERQRELATIKVLGFHERELQAYIFRETNLLTVLGGFIGLFAGRIMETFVISTVEVDIVMFGRNISAQSYLLSFLITLAFSQIVNLFMRRKLSKINMVESLKSID